MQKAVKFSLFRRVFWFVVVAVVASMCVGKGVKKRRKEKNGIQRSVLLCYGWLWCRICIYGKRVAFGCISCYWKMVLFPFYFCEMRCLYISNPVHHPECNRNKQGKRSKKINFSDFTYFKPIFLLFVTCVPIFRLYCFVFLAVFCWQNMY